MLNEKLLKPYSPKETEDKIYKLWEESGFFAPEAHPPWVENPDTNPNYGKTFSIVLPPPNVTGTLHMGHAAMLAIEDILVRYNRMRGKKTLWIPGTDHAAIATESKVEELLYKKEKKTRHDLGREAFLKHVEQFAQESRDSIVHQLKKMGSSLDWSREAFTLDEKRELAVRTAFKNMYDDGLIYRGERIVNWDPKMQSNVSDDEIEWVEQKTHFYYLKYGPFTIGTARPETKFGDKYVVMHPKDSRYKQYKHGDKIELEWINGPITATVIKDAAVNMEFGTGVMTITPWHDTTDFEIAERHNLDKEQIINERGILLPIAGEFAGEHIKKARAKIVEKLKQKGLLEKVDENYVNRIATNYRGGGIIEPQIRKQWFINVHAKFKAKNSKLKGIKTGQEVSLKELMLHVVKSKQINIIPDNFAKIYFHWIENLRDWCISRQIWYGHRIPVYYCKRESNSKLQEPNTKQIQNSKFKIQNSSEECAKPIVSIEKIEKCPNCDGPAAQDPDTLDTWFSSGLWTFSTLGWPEQTDDLKTYHPTDVLETGYDILFFWIARMILMSGYNVGDIPFKTVYLHGLVRDEQGRKMSKSLGNIIDPLVMIEKYGADATRLSLIFGNTPGTDLKLSEDKVRGQKHFANKLWNIARFILEHTEGETLGNGFPKRNQYDEALRAERRAVLDEVTEHIDNFRLYLAIEKLYHYIWHALADKIIEDSKIVFKNGNAEEVARRKQFLLHTLDVILRVLHPFMPFVTEEIWSLMPHTEKNLLMVSKWPTN